MKLIKKANKTTIKMSKSEWLQIGKTAGWVKESQYMMGGWAGTPKDKPEKKKPIGIDRQEFIEMGKKLKEKQKKKELENDNVIDQRKERQQEDKKPQVGVWPSSPESLDK